MAAKHTQRFPLDTTLGGVYLGVHASAPFILNNQITSADGKDLNPSDLNERVNFMPSGGCAYRFLDVYLAAYIPSGESISGAPSINCYGRLPKTGKGVADLFDLSVAVHSTVPAFDSIEDPHPGSGLLIPLSPVGNDNTSTTDTVAFDISTPSVSQVDGSSNALNIYPRRTFHVDGCLEVAALITAAGTVSDPGVKPFLIGVLRS